MAEYVGSGGKLNEEGYTRHLYSLFQSGVQSGSVYTSCQVTQRGAGANMSVDVAVGDLFIDISSSYGYPAWVASAASNVSVSASDPSNPRKDIVVAYIDLAAITTGSTNNPSALKFKAVAGTPAGSPADPSGATIQAAIGAGNPYISLARIAVAAGATSISNANITDLRKPVSVKTPIKTPFLTKSATYTLVPTDMGQAMPFSASGGAVTVNLPAAADVSGLTVTIIKSDSSTNAVTIDASGSETINGSLTYKIYNQYQAITITSDGTGWYITNIVDGLWQSWTPSGYTNITVGNGTLVAKFMKSGVNIDFLFKLTLGSTSAVGSNADFALPVAVSSDYGTVDPIGTVYSTPGGTLFPGWATTNGTANRAQIIYGVATGSFVNASGTSSTVPGTWANTNVLSVAGSYQCASLAS